MLTILTLTILPFLLIVYLCLSKKHKEMVNNLLKKLFGWFLIRRRKEKMEEAGNHEEKARLEEKQKEKEQEIKEKAKEDIEKVKSE